MPSARTVGTHYRQPNDSPARCGAAAEGAPGIDGESSSSEVGLGTLYGFDSVWDGLEYLVVAFV